MVRPCAGTPVTPPTTRCSPCALGFAAFVFIISWFLPSPYGRFASTRFGVSLGPRLGWFLMELPATLSFSLLLLPWAAPRRAGAARCSSPCGSSTTPTAAFSFPLSHSRRARRPRAASASWSSPSAGCVTSLHGYFHATLLHAPRHALHDDVAARSALLCRLRHLLHLLRAQPAVGRDHPPPAHARRARRRASRAIASPTAGCSAGSRARAT